MRMLTNLTDLTDEALQRLERRHLEIIRQHPSYSVTGEYLYLRLCEIRRILFARPTTPNEIPCEENPMYARLDGKLVTGTVEQIEFGDDADWMLVDGIRYAWWDDDTVDLKIGDKVIFRHHLAPLDVGLPLVDCADGIRRPHEPRLPNRTTANHHQIMETTHEA